MCQGWKAILQLIMGKHLMIVKYGEFYGLKDEKFWIVHSVIWNTTKEKRWKYDINKNLHEQICRPSMV